jgi:hypothetical protein
MATPKYEQIYLRAKTSRKYFVGGWRGEGGRGESLVAVKYFEHVIVYTVLFKSEDKQVNRGQKYI